MPHQNEQLLRAGYDGFSKNGDLEPMLGAITDDIAWQDSTLGPLAGKYTGKDEVLGLFRRDRVLAVGGYDERMATEDIDLSWRLLMAGWHTAYLEGLIRQTA